jgi:xylulokinase
VLAVVNSLADCLDSLRGTGTPIERLLLIGGGAKSAALRSVLPDTVGMTVAVPEVREYVALGAARQAAWAATGRLPKWGRRIEAELQTTDARGPAIYRQRYAQLRAAAIFDHA